MGSLSGRPLSFIFWTSRPWAVSAQITATSIGMTQIAQSGNRGMNTDAPIALTVATTTPTVRASTFPANTPIPDKTITDPTMSCHHPQVVALAPKSES